MITFADLPLLLADPEGRLQEFLDRWLPLADMRLFAAEPIGTRTTRNESRSTEFARVGLPVPNWPAPPRPKINSLWWPSGASRWAVGLFVTDDQGMVELRTRLAGTAGKADLVLREDARQDERAKVPRTITAEMFLLSPRRLSWSSNGRGTWLLPLVDERYFWQFRDTGSLVVDSDMTWLELIAELGAQMGLPAPIVVDPIPTAYYQPDQVELYRQYENAAVVLDAVAACIGQRILRAYGGEVYSRGTSGEWLQADLDANLLLGDTPTHTKHFQIAGGHYEITDNFLPSTYQSAIAHEPGDQIALPRYGLVPSQVRVVFPRYSGGRAQADGDLWAYTLSASQYATTATQEDGTSKTFFDTAAADFSGSPAPDQPNNLAQLDNLAAQIATDYYAWLDYAPYDVTFGGLGGWVPTAFDDYVWTHAAVQRGDKSYACYTRACSLPPNFGVDQLLHRLGFTSSASSPGSSSSSSLSSSSLSSSSSRASSPSSGSSPSSSQGSSPSSESSSEAGPADSSMSSLEASEGLVCVQVVTDVYLDIQGEDCDLVVCTREICFTGTVGEEDCGSESESPLGYSESSSEAAPGQSSHSSEILGSGSSLSSLGHSSPSSASSSSSSSSTSSQSSSASSSTSSRSSSSSGGCLLVTGIQDPDVTGTYCAVDSYGGRTVYGCGAWFLWWDEVEAQWIISLAIGGGMEPDDEWYAGELYYPTGPFNAEGNAVGQAIVDYAS